MKTHCNNIKSALVRHWKTPIIAFCSLWLISSILSLTPIGSLSNYSLPLNGIAFIILLLSWISLANQKQWRKCIFSILFTTVITIGLSFLFAITLLYIPIPDYFGKEHPLPEGIEYTIPYKKTSDTILSADKIINTGDFLQLWANFEGGIYQYDFYYGALPAGDIFLKCYEITENIPLSPQSIRQESAVQIKGTTSFSQLVHGQQFTIYEGDWGDYYAARIEVWHKDSSTLQERKLYEKIYRVEGWTR